MAIRMTPAQAAGVEIPPVDSAQRPVQVQIVKDIKEGKSK
jgi:hypothetical protein